MTTEILEKTQIETEKRFDWNSVLKLAKNDREEAAQEIYDNYFAGLETGEKISFSIPRVKTDEYPILGLMRDALEKKFPESEFPDSYSLKLIFSELLSNALDHGEGEKVDVKFSFGDRGVTIALHEQSKRALRWDEESQKLEIFNNDCRFAPISDKLNRSFNIKKLEQASSAIENEFLLSPRVEEIAAPPDSELKNLRGRGFCVIAGYMDEGDELRLKIHPDGTFTAEFFKSINKGDEI